MLRSVVEFDVGGAVDLQPAEFMERNSLGPKTMGRSVGVELDGNVHGGLFLLTGGTDSGGSEVMPDQ